MRFRRSGISVMLLIESSMLNEPTRNHFGLAARFLYLREGGFREQMRGNMQRRLQLSVSQNLEPAADPLAALVSSSRRTKCSDVRRHLLPLLLLPFLRRASRFRTEAGRLPLRGFCNLALRRRAALRRLLPSLRGRWGTLLRRFFRRLSCFCL